MIAFYLFRLFFIMWILFTFIYSNEFDLDFEIRCEQGYFAEQVTGDIEKALNIYHSLLREEKITDKLKVNILLHVAMCLEKQGKDKEAESYYNIIQNDYISFSEAVQIAKKQLEHIKNRYELRKKLEQKEPEKEQSTLDEKVIISMALYDYAKESFEKNDLQRAKETLQRSISFNYDNQKAKKLLQEVEKKIILTQDELFTRKDSEYKWLKGLEKKILEEDSAEFKEILYDFSEIFGEEREKINDYTLKDNFLLLLKNELSIMDSSMSNAINFINGNLLVRHNNIFHEKIEKLLQSLTKKKDIYYINVVIASGDGEILQKELTHLKLNFLSAEDGCYYTEIDTSGIQELISQCYDKGIHLIFLPEITLLNKVTSSLEKSFEVPLVKGYENNKVNFQIYEEGFQFVFKMDYQNVLLNTEVLAKKIQRPIETIPLNTGPLQIPFVMKQKANFSCKLDRNRSVLALGLLNPISSRYLPSSKFLTESHRLIIFFTFQKIPVKDFLLRSDSEIDLFAKKDDEHYPRYYPISIWQKIIDFNTSSPLTMETKESRNDFLLNLCNSYIKEKTEKTILKIIADRLLIYSTEEVHNKVQYLLNNLRENSNFLQRFSTYVFSMDSATLNSITSKNWKTTNSNQKKDGIKVYTSENSTEVLLNELTTKGKLIKELPPVICSNTQSIEIANLQLNTFWEGITITKSHVPETKVRNILEGFSVKLRNIFISNKENFIDAQCNIFEKTVKNSSYKLEDSSFSIETPETKIQRGHARLNYSEKQKYLLSGFKSDESNYVFLIVPNKIEDDKKLEKKDEKENSKK